MKKKEKGSGRQIDTGGGTYVEGNVDTGGAPFVGGNQVVKAEGGSIATGGSMTDSTVTISNTTAQQQGVSVADLVALLAEMRALLPQAGLDQENLEAIDGDFRIVEEQAKKEKPKRGLALNRLKSAAELISSVSGAAVAVEKLAPVAQQALDKLGPMAQQAIEWAGHLLH